MNEKRVLVTGSSRGIGQAIARRLAKDGYSVVIHGRTLSDELKQFSNELGGEGYSVDSVAFDVADREAARTSLAEYVEKKGPFYGVVLSAGIHRDAPLAGMSGEDWDAVMRTNLDGAFNVLQPLLLPMLSLHQGGRVVMLSSISGLVGNRGQCNYSASKSALFGLTKSLAQELGKRQVLVNCIAPGVFATEMIEGVDLKGLIDNIPLRRLGNVVELSGVVSFLFSEDASYITGQVISVNGGMV